MSSIESSPDGGKRVQEIPERLCKGTFRLTKIASRLNKDVFLAESGKQHKDGFLESAATLRVGERTTMVSQYGDIAAWKIEAMDIVEEAAGTYLIYTARSVYRFQVLGSEKPALESGEPTQVTRAAADAKEHIDVPRRSIGQKIVNLFTRGRWE